MLYNVKQSKFLLCHYALLLHFLLNISLAKQILKNEGTFDVDTDEVPDHELERGVKAMARINLSFPGTKWCGPGNTANNYNDLGDHAKEDKCCRSHDHCDNIPSGGMKYGLTNDDAFTRLHCRCDKEFKQCLKSINSRLSNKIGMIYFSFRDKCYKNHHPVVSCNKEETKLYLHRCVQYIVDTSQPRKYQWFDMPFYSSKYELDVADAAL